MYDILKNIKKCDMNKPYIFVSYSRCDKEVVYRDVLKFQEYGYNIWLERKNLDRTKPSWKEDAIRAIEEMECKLVLFYVSKNSLTSEACLNEMKATRNENTKRYHKRSEVKFIAIEVEEINDIVDFQGKIFEEIKFENTNKEQRRKKLDILDMFITDFFNDNNEKIRIKPNVPNRQYPYYEEIIENFPDITKIKNHEPRPIIDNEVNEIEQSVQLNKKQNVSSSDLPTKQLTFWQNFISYCERNNRKNDIAAANPNKVNWYYVSVGKKDFHIEFTITGNKYFSIVLYTDTREAFVRLESKKAEIEKLFGHEFDWNSSKKDSKAKRIIYKIEADIFNESKQNELFAWVIDTFDVLKNALVCVGEFGNSKV